MPTQMEVDASSEASSDASSDVSSEGSVSLTGSQAAMVDASRSGDDAPQLNEAPAQSDTVPTVESAGQASWNDRSTFAVNEVYGGSDEDKPYHPSADLVHVTAISPHDSIHSSEVLLGTSTLRSQTSELVFQTELSKFLLGDLTSESVEQEAVRLLEGLVSRLSSVTKQKHAFIFIAYDLGSLVLKRALILAERYPELYPGVFSSTSRIIFSGCPHRASSRHTLELKLLQFLQDAKSEERSHLITLTAIQHLADFLLRESNKFIDSKITLRRRVVSLYAGKKSPGKIHRLWDSFTASLGVQPENLIQEQAESDAQFPLLAHFMAYDPKSYDTLLHPDVSTIEASLAALAAPHRPSQAEPSPSLSLETLPSKGIYDEWLKPTESRPLYIHGSCYRDVRGLSDLITVAWWERMTKKKTPGGKPLVFTFDATDPLRNSISSMVASFVLEVTHTSLGIWEDHQHSTRDVLQDWLFFRPGWSEESCIALFEALRLQFFDRNTLFVLKDLDQCAPHSRTLLLAYLRGLRSRCDDVPKILITSRSTKGLQKERYDALELDLDDLAADASSAVAERTDLRGLSRLDPNSVYSSMLNEALTRLGPLDDSMKAKLGFAQDHSGWPASPSFEAVEQFTRLVQLISPEECLDVALDKFLRQTPDYENFCWILGWILAGYRPLSLDELASLLHRRRDKGPWLSSSTRQGAAAEHRQQLKSWLQVLADFDHDNQVTLRHNVRYILDSDSGTEDLTWTDVRRTAHQTIVDFSLAYLSTAEIQTSLESLFSSFQSRVERQKQSSQQPTTETITSDGEDILFYIVQALPHHISKLECPSSDRDRALERLVGTSGDNPYTRWAKVYWAMSNPFSRLPEPPETPLSILVQLDILSPDEMARYRRRAPKQCVVASAGSRTSRDWVAEYLGGSPEYADVEEARFLHDVLLAAIRGHNERVAIEIVQAIASRTASEDGDSKVEWPKTAIWAASWLNMDRLVEALLSHGVVVEPKSSTTLMFSSPLSLAASVGHEAVVKVLVKHGAADLHRHVRGWLGCFQSAASQGHDGVIRQLFATNPELVNAKGPSTALYYAASYGSWSSLETLLQLGAVVTPADNALSSDPMWTPLLVACYYSYPRAAEALLKNGADANELAPRGFDTPLWFAAVRDPSVECVRVLLRYGADPNHERLRPPLITEIAASEGDDATIVDVCSALRSEPRPIDIGAATDEGMTALMRAASRGRLLLVRWLLDNGADIDALDAEGRGALHYALYAAHGRAGVVEELLTRKAKISHHGLPLLHLALQLDRTEIVQRLLDLGADPDEKDSDGCTLLNRAVAPHKADVVEMLIAKKADLNHRDNYGWPPIFDAAIYVKDVAITRLLADNGADLTQTVQENTLLHQVVAGPASIMRILLEFTKYLKLEARNANDETALLRGSLQRSDVADCECLKLLILAGADVNARDRVNETALHNAVRNDNYPLLTVLLSQPDVDIDAAAGWGTPLQLACRRRNRAAARSLLDRGADVNKTVHKVPHATPLMAAVRPYDSASRDQDSGEMDQLVRELVSRGAQVKQVTEGNMFYTVLSAACIGAGAGTINYLLDQGAAADLVDPVYGLMPLHFAAANGVENFRTILLAYRGDIMRPDKSGKTALHWAAQLGNVETVKLILYKVADNAAARQRCVSVPDDDGWTPLCWAVRPYALALFEGMKSEARNHAAVVRLLLDSGADPTVRCPLGNGDASGPEFLTLLELARRSGADDEVINMLAQRLEQDGDETARSEQAGGAPVRKYAISTISCDFCLSYIFGLRYKCSSCADYDVCTKCLPNIGKYHNAGIWGDSEPHEFKRRPGEEYEEVKPEPAGDKAGGEDTKVPPPLDTAGLAGPERPGGLRRADTNVFEEDSDDSLSDLSSDLSL